MDLKINLPVAVVLEELKGELILVVDHPDKKKAVTLNLLKRESPDLIVGQGRVGNRHASCRVRCRELPRRIHADDVE